MLKNMAEADFLVENHKEWTSYVKEFSKNFVEFPDEVSSDDTPDVEDTTENSDSDWD